MTDNYISFCRTRRFELVNAKKKKKKSRGGLSWLSWCFEPSQPLRITSGPNARRPSISRVFISQIIISQFSFSKLKTQIPSAVSDRNPPTAKAHVLEPIYVLRALNTQHRNLQPQLRQAKTRERFEKNVGDWTGRVEISQEKSLTVSVAFVAIY